MFCHHETKTSPCPPHNKLRPLRYTAFVCQRTAYSPLTFLHSPHRSAANHNFFDNRLYKAREFFIAFCVKQSLAGFPLKFIEKTGFKNRHTAQILFRIRSWNCSHTIRRIGFYLIEIAQVKIANFAISTDRVCGVISPFQYGGRDIR